MDARDYVILVEGPTETGSYGAWCPDVPGVYAADESYDGTVALMRDALQEHLDWLRESGDEVPGPSGRPALVHIAA